MSATSTKTGGGTSIKTATESDGGGGPGTIEELTSTDGSVTIESPTGPVTNLKVTSPVAATWRSAMLGFVQAQFTGLNNDGDPFLDFLDTNQAATLSNWAIKQPDADPTSTASISATLNGGVLVCTTVDHSAVGSSGVQVVKCEAGGGWVPFIANIKTQPWAVVSRGAMRYSTVDANTFFALAACFAHTFTNAVAFGFRAGDTKLSVFDGAAYTLTTVTPDDAIYDWVLLSDGANIKAWRGQVLTSGMGPVLATVPVGVNVPTAPGIAVAQVRELAGGAPAQQLLLDKLWGIGPIQS